LQVEQLSEHVKRLKQAYAGEQLKATALAESLAEARAQCVLLTTSLQTLHDSNPTAIALLFADKAVGAEAALLQTVDLLRAELGKSVTAGSEYQEMLAQLRTELCRRDGTPAALTTVTHCASCAARDQALADVRTALVAALDNPHAAAVLHQQQVQWQHERTQLEQRRHAMVAAATAAAETAEAGWARACDDSAAKVAQLEATVASIRRDHADALAATVANAAADAVRQRDVAVQQVVCVCLHWRGSCVLTESWEQVRATLNEQMRAVQEAADADLAAAKVCFFVCVCVCFIG
jgi:hypothetical protein